jgi:tetratricopeptide (TPR) repeat protein
MYDRARQELTIAASQAGKDSIGPIEHRIGEVERLLGRFRAAEEHFERALSHPVERAAVLADWALLAHRTGDDAKAERLADEALRAAQDRGNDHQLSRVHNILAVVTPDLGPALEHAEAALRLAGEDEVLRMAALNNQALLFAAQGDDERAGILIAEAIALAERTGHRHREAALWNHLADLHHRGGREREAKEALTKSVSLFAEIDDGVLEPELWLLTRW